MTLGHLTDVVVQNMQRIRESQQSQNLTRPNMMNQNYVRANMRNNMINGNLPREMVNKM